MSLREYILTVADFMSNLRREPGPFFFYLFTTFLAVLAMSGIFRTIASASRTLSQAMVPAALLILALVMFTGFVIPIDYMLGWSRWINYIDPMAYIFESLMINEVCLRLSHFCLSANWKQFAGRQYLCTSFIPSSTVSGYANISNENRICSAVGAVAGNEYVQGTDYIKASFQYDPSHKWRNIGIVIGFIMCATPSLAYMVLDFLTVISFFHATYMMFTEIVTAKKSEGEVLVFRRGHRPAQFKESKSDAELGNPQPSSALAVADTVEASMPNKESGAIQEATSVFHWRYVNALRYSPVPLER